MTTWLARLDKRTGGRVLCARVGCDRELARVAETEYGRVLEFPMGWAPTAEGMWRLTRHARERERHGHAPGFRRPPRKMVRGEQLIAKHPTPLEYPARAQCPHCQLIQVLDAERLDVVVEPRGVAPLGNRVMELARRAILELRDEQGLDEAMAEVFRQLWGSLGSATTTELLQELDRSLRARGDDLENRERMRRAIMGEVTEEERREDEAFWQEFRQALEPVEDESPPIGPRERAALPMTQPTIRWKSWPPPRLPRHEPPPIKLLEYRARDA